MKKLLIMSNTLYSGGAERVLQVVLNHLKEEKYEITLYSMHREPIDTSIFKRNFDYKVIFEKKKTKNVFLRILYRFLYQIKGYIFNHFPTRFFYSLYIHGKYDIEIAFVEGESTKIIAGSTNKRSKKIAWVHCNLEQTPWTSFLYKSVSDEANHYKKFDKIVCVSNSAKLAFCRKFGIDSNYVITHYNPIDVCFINEQAKKNLIFLQTELVQIIAVGRLVKEKGFDRLVCAAKKLFNEGLEFQLHIIGDGEQYGLLQNYIKDNNLEEKIILHGYQKNPYALMKQGDILVCSSRSEGYSLVIAEAIVLGLAIVTTACAGPCELIMNGKYGILTENSTEGIFKGLRKILIKDGLIAKYKILSGKRAAMFDLNKNIREVEKIIDE